MMQAHPVPDIHARGGLSVEDMARGAVGLIGTDQRHDQIDLSAGVDHPADVAQNSVDFANCAEASSVIFFSPTGRKKIMTQRCPVRDKNPTRGCIFYFHVIVTLSEVHHDSHAQSMD